MGRKQSTRGQKRRNKTLGIGDQREQIKVIRGHQNYSSVQNGASGTQLFISTNAIPISPDSLGTQVADLANHFNQYKFTKLWFEFMPARYVFRGLEADIANTEFRNLFAFGYEDDGVPTFTVTFDNICTLQHVLVTPTSGWPSRGANTLKISGLGKRWYYTKDALSTDPAIRQTVQGILYGEARTSISNVTDYGKLMIHYEVHFKDLCPNQSVTLSALINEARLGRTAELAKLCLMLKHASILTTYEGVLPKHILDEYSNEECRMLGVHRPLAPTERPIKTLEYNALVSEIIGDVERFSQTSGLGPRTGSSESVEVV